MHNGLTDYKPAISTPCNDVQFQHWAILKNDKHRRLHIKRKNVAGITSGSLFMNDDATNNTLIVRHKGWTWDHVAALDFDRETLVALFQEIGEHLSANGVLLHRLLPAI